MDHIYCASLFLVVGHGPFAVCMPRLVKGRGRCGVERAVTENGKIDFPGFLLDATCHSKNQNHKHGESLGSFDATSPLTVF